MKSLLLKLSNDAKNLALIAALFFITLTTFSQSDSILTNTRLQAGQYGMGLSSAIPGTTQLNLFDQPLIILDGIPYLTYYSKISDISSADLSDVARIIGIPEEEIESVSIITDPTEITLLGNSGIYGAVNIKTKGITSKNLKINYNLKLSFNWEEAGYDMLNGDQYSTSVKEAYMNANGFPLDTRLYKEFSYLSTEPYYYYNYGQNTNWFKEITQLGSQQDHNISINGRIKGFGYRLGANLQKGNGVVIHTGHNNYSLNAMLDYNWQNIIKFNASLRYINQVKDDYYNDEFYSDDLFRMALITMPNMTVYEYTVNGFNTNNLFQPEGSLIQPNTTNPVEMAQNAFNETTYSSFLQTANLVFEPVENFSYNLSFSRSNNSRTRETYRKTYFQTKPLTLNISNENTNILLRNNLNYQLLFKNKSKLVFNFNLNFEKHSYFQDYDYQNSGNINRSTTYSNLNYRDAFVRIHYGIKDKYKFTISNNLLSKTIFFRNLKMLNHSYRAEWNIKKERFCQNLKFVNQLSLYASGGFNSFYFNQRNRFDKLRVNYDQNNMFYKMGSGIESTSYYDINLSLSVLNEKINFNLQYFQKLSKNRQVNLLTSDSFETYARYNDDRVKSINLHINSNIYYKKDFDINISLDIERLYRYAEPLNYHTSSSVGTYYYNSMKYNWSVNPNQPYGNFNGLESLGVYQYSNYVAGSQENAPVAKDVNGNIILGENGEIIPLIFGYDPSGYHFQGGDMIYFDNNHDGYINREDYLNIGNAAPKLSGTITPTLRIKNWWLGSFFNFNYGNDIINFSRAYLEGMYNANNQTKNTLKRWKQPGDLTNIPRALYRTGYNWIGSSRFVEDGSFLRLKAITLKYTVPEAITKKIHLKNLSCYLTGKNLFTWSKYTGADPDINLNTNWTDFGVDYNYRSPIHEVTFGINVGI